MRYKNAVYVVLFLTGCRYKREGGGGVKMSKHGISYIPRPKERVPGDNPSNQTNQ